MDDNYKLLLIDDEPDMLEKTSSSLRSEGYKVFTAVDGESGIRLALSVLPHLVLLDMKTPEKNGVEVCKKIRSHRLFDNTIVAFMSASTEDFSLFAGFEAGADDFIAKPVSIKLLQARIKALLKRNKPVTEKCSSSATIIINQKSFTVVKNGKHIYLPKKEFDLLALLMSKPGQVFERKEIHGALWGKNNAVNFRTIDVHIRKLREKIGDNHIKTLNGVGYKFVN